VKILIRLPNWLGDVVMSTAFVNAVRALYRDAVIDVIIKKELAGVAGMISGLNDIYPFSKQDHKGLPGAYRFGKKLKSNQYDLFFNLPESLSSQVLGWASGAKKRVGFAKEGGFFLLTNPFKKPLNMHRVEEYVALLEMFTGKSVVKKIVKLEAGPREVSSPKRLLINFNSEASSRRMPIEKAIHIVNMLTETYKDVKLAFIGSAKEAPFIAQIIAGANNDEWIEDLSGKTNLKQLAELMTNSIGILSTDSGPAHLANGVGTPTVVLFGAGNEHNTAPYNKERLFVIRYGELTCEPCVKNTCPLFDLPKCMQMIDELKIKAALNAIIQERRS
jgi:lipopolysaccharide heptosyltransferase II